MSPSPTTLKDESPREMSASTSITSQLRPMIDVEKIFAGIFLD